MSGIPAATKFTIRQVILNQTTFTVIKAPIDCNYWKVTGGNISFIIASDLDDPTHQETIPQLGTAQVMSTPVFTPTNLYHRFNNGDTLLYAKALTGTMTAILEVIL